MQATVDHGVAFAAAVLGAHHAREVDAAGRDQVAAEFDEPPPAGTIVLLDQLAHAAARCFEVELGIAGVGRDSEAAAEVDLVERDSEFAFPRRRAFDELPGVVDERRRHRSTACRRRRGARAARAPHRRRFW